MSVRVGVFGATGYSGRELVRLRRHHPRATGAFTTGSQKGHLPHEKGLEQAADAYRLALPHGGAEHILVRRDVRQREASVVGHGEHLPKPS